MVRVNLTDKVTVTCYGKTETMTRGKAITHYTKGMWCCDPYSSEYGRYENIVAQLNAGMMVVDDENEDW